MNKEIESIVILDTSIATNNVGDEIIMDAVNNQLYNVFTDSMFVKLPTHEIIYKTGISLIRKSDQAFLGGSNILYSAMDKYKQWKIMLWQSFFVKEKITLLGVGWRDYQGSPNWFTKFLLKNILSKKIKHSVRDSYTEKFLKDLGFNNVINTSCPTMWELTEEHCSQIPLEKSENVIFTLTDYNQDIEQDTFLIQTLLDHYQNVYYWVQGKKDLSYLQSLKTNVDITKINIISPNLRSYDDFLSHYDCDYIGTRLHGGIRAIQKRKRAIIIGIDNRALEKQKDFNLHVIERKYLKAELLQRINSGFKTQIKLPLDNINTWKKQFL